MSATEKSPPRLLTAYELAICIRMFRKTRYYWS